MAERWIRSTDWWRSSVDRYQICETYFIEKRFRFVFIKRKFSAWFFSARHNESHRIAAISSRKLFDQNELCWKWKSNETNSSVDRRLSIDESEKRILFSTFNQWRRWSFHQFSSNDETDRSIFVHYFRMFHSLLREWLWKSENFIFISHNEWISTSFFFLKISCPRNNKSNFLSNDERFQILRKEFHVEQKHSSDTFDSPSGLLKKLLCLGWWVHVQMTEKM